MPVHDAGQYLQEALTSVLDDLPERSELVVVDDGSSDSSPSLIAATTDTDPRVRVVRHATAQGVSRALNAGISAPGCPEFIAVAEHDDVVLPGRFAAQLDALRRDRRLGAVSSEGRYLGPEGRTAGRVANGPRTPEEFAEQRAAGTAMLIPHPGVMYRKSALDESGLYDPAFDSAQDLEIMNRLVYGAGWSLQILPHRHFLYRVHPGAMSFSHLTLQRLMTRYVAYRNSRQLLGAPFDDFETWRSANTPTTRTRLTWFRKDRGALMFRRAGLAWVSRRPLSFAGNLIGATVLHPRWVLMKLRVARGGS